MKNTIKTRRYKGFSFIEISIVVAIIAAGVAIAISIGSSIRAQNRAKDAVTEIATVISVAQRLYKPQHSYNYLDTLYLARSSYMPENLINSTYNGLINVYGKPILVTPGYIGSGNVANHPFPTIWLKYHIHSGQDCISVASALLTKSYVDVAIRATAVHNLSEVENACGPVVMNRISYPGTQINVWAR